MVEPKIAIAKVLYAIQPLPKHISISQCSVRHSDTHTYNMYLEGDGKLARPTGTTNHTQQTPLDSTPPTSGESKVGRINTIQIKSSVVNVPVRLH